MIGKPTIQTMTAANFVALHRGNAEEAGNQANAPESAAKAGVIQTLNMSE